MEYLAYHIQCMDEQQIYELVGVLDIPMLLGFEEKGLLLNAYFEEGSDTKKIERLLQRYDAAYSKERIAHQNWNELWESNFDPVRIQDFCYIYAHFHKAEPGYAHSIRITPKMSFGTGHHATTELMILMMRAIDLKGKRVLDFGTGTGVLAILAQQLGAASVLALDNDEWSYENAVENCAQNESDHVTIMLGSLELCEGQEPYDVVLANINLHILQRYMPDIHALLKPKGVLLLSGLLLQDLEQITQDLSAVGLRIKEQTDKDKWMCLKVENIDQASA